jgi:hypothetical protein
MKTRVFSLTLLPAVLLALANLTGCESTDGGGSTQVNQVSYYGTGFHDPYYYGHYDDDPDIIVTPPPAPGRPDNGPRPSQPIARPPSSGVGPRPSPSIPSAPRPSPRMSGGGGGGRRR